MAKAAAIRRPAVARRLAAVVALAVPILALVVGVLAVLHDPGLLVVLIASIVVTVVSVWYALTRQGVPRLVGLSGVALGLVGLVVVGLRNWAAVLLVVALLAVFGVSGRYAMGRDRPTLLAVGRRDPEIPPARHGVLIINPWSGGGKAARFDLPARARQRGIEPIVLQRGDDLRQLAERAIAAGADVIGMAGGDGSQALVATVAVEHDVAHVCIPSGTRNHFALDLGLNREDVVGALDAFTDGVERRVDLARVNERVFVNNASLGVYAKVVQSDAYRDAKLTTWAKQLPQLLGPDAPLIDLEFAGPDATPYADAPLILVSNNPYSMAQLAGAGTRPRMDTGQRDGGATHVTNMSLIPHTTRDIRGLSRTEAIPHQGCEPPDIIGWLSAKIQRATLTRPLLRCRWGIALGRPLNVLHALHS